MAILVTVILVPLIALTMLGISKRSGLVKRLVALTFLGSIVGELVAIFGMDDGLILGVLCFALFILSSFWLLLIGAQRALSN
jgi:hypothetical protein